MKYYLQAVSPRQFVLRGSVMLLTVAVVASGTFAASGLASVEHNIGATSLGTIAGLPAGVFAHRDAAIVCDLAAGQADLQLDALRTLTPAEAISLGAPVAQTDLDDATVAALLQGATSVAIAGADTGVFVSAALGVGGQWLARLVAGASDTTAIVRGSSAWAKLAYMVGLLARLAALVVAGVWIARALWARRPRWLRQAAPALAWGRK